MKGMCPKCGEIIETEWEYEKVSQRYKHAEDVRLPCLCLLTSVLTTGDVPF